MILRWLLSLCLIFSFMPVEADARNVGIWYEIKSGDTLSQIAYFHYPRVYGKEGGLKKLQKLNPSKALAVLFPGDKIFIGREEIEAITENLSPAIETPDLSERKPSSESLFRYSQVSLQYGSYYSILNSVASNGSKGTLISNLNTSIDAQWMQILSSQLKTFQNFRLRNEEYIQDSEDIKIENKIINLKGFSAGAIYDFSSRLSFSTSIGLGQELYYKALAGGNGITLEGVSVPQLNAAAQFLLWEGDPFRISIEGKGIILLPAETQDYKTKLGKGFFSRLLISQQFSKFDIFAAVFYQKLNQDSSILEINRTDGGINFGLNWKMGN